MPSIEKSTMSAQACLDDVSLTPPTSDDDESCGGLDKQQQQHDSSIDDTARLTVEGTSSSDDSLDRSLEEEEDESRHEALRHRPRMFDDESVAVGLVKHNNIPDSSSLDEPSRHPRRGSVIDGKIHGFITRRRSGNHRPIASALVILVLWVMMLCSSSHQYPWNLLQDEPTAVLAPIRRGPRFTDPDWSQFLTTKAPQIRQAIRKHRPGRSFTILLSGSRLDLIQQSIDAHAQCSTVEQIQVDWKQSESRLPRKVFRQPKVVATSDGEIISTDGVLVLDEDVVVTCADLERAFGIWRKNRDRMVGFYPFVHGDDFSTEAVRRGSGSYSLVSSRAAFVHKIYVESFPSRRNDEACRPLTLSVHCSAISSKPPMAVAGRPRELRTMNVYQSQYASEDKSTCLRQWVEGHGMDDLPWEGATFLEK